MLNFTLFLGRHKYEMIFVSTTDTTNLILDFSIWPQPSL